MKALVFLVDGFEEIEAVTPIDVLRRGGVFVKTVSLNNEYFVTGSHTILMKADCLFKDLDKNEIDTYNCLILPGGPGTKQYQQYPEALAILKDFAEVGKILAAICAAPSVLGACGLLEGKKATCFPGYEEALLGAELQDAPFVRDGNILTGKAAGSAMDFSKALLSLLMGDEVAERICKSMYVQ